MRTFSPTSTPYISQFSAAGLIYEDYEAVVESQECERRRALNPPDLDLNVCSHCLCPVATSALTHRGSCPGFPYVTYVDSKGSTCAVQLRFGVDDCSLVVYVCFCGVCVLRALERQRRVGRVKAAGSPVNLLGLYTRERSEEMRAHLEGREFIGHDIAKVRSMKCSLSPQTAESSAHLHL